MEDFSLSAFEPPFKRLSTVGCESSMTNGNDSWLYIIEGVISILVVGWVWFGLPNDPTRAKFWSAEEKEIMEIRETQRQEYLGSLKFEWTEVARAFQDPKVYTTYAPDAMIRVLRPLRS
jgi:hypothetical protein